MNSLLNPTQQIPLQDLQNNGNSNGHQQIQNPQFDPTSSHDDFLEQMLSTLPSCSWSDLKSPWDPPKADETGGANLDNNVGFHYDEILASKLRQHQINGGGGSSPATAAMKMMMQQQMMLAGRAAAAAAAGGGGGGGGLTMPLSLGSSAAGSHQNDIVDGSSFKSPNHQVHVGFYFSLFPVWVIYELQWQYIVFLFREERVPCKLCLIVLVLDLCMGQISHRTSLSIFTILRHALFSFYFLHTKKENATSLRLELSI